MDVMDRTNFIFGGIIAALSYVFGASWPLFAIFMLFNIADYITGIMKSRMANKINSNDGLKGIMKKLGYWLMILIAFAAGYWFIAMGKLLGINLKITSLLGWFVLASLTVNELRSILENFVEAGYNVPRILIKGLEVATKAFNEDPPEDDTPEDDTPEQE